jgi:hypothetical protein
MMPEERTESDRRTMWAVLAIAVACRLAWWTLRISVIENEGVEYARIAETWFGGEGYLGVLGGPEVMFPPLYPALIGVVSWLTHDSALAARLISLVAGLVVVANLSAMTRDFLGPRAGLVTGLLAATHPLLIAFSVSTYVEALTLALVTTALRAAAVTVRSSAIGWPVVSGVAIGCAYLTRPEAILLVVPLSAWLVFSLLRRHVSGVIAVRTALAPLAVATLIAAPYAIHLSVVAGQPRWEGKTAINAIINDRMSRGMSYEKAARGLDVGQPFAKAGHHLGGPDLWPDQRSFFEPASQAPQGPSASELIRSLPSRALSVVKLVRSALSDWTSIARIPIGVVFIAIGLASGWWRRKPMADIGFLLLVILASQIVFLFGVMFLWSRYAAPILPLVLPWFGGGLVWAAEKAGAAIQKRSPRPLPRLDLVLACSIAVLSSAAALRRVAGSPDFLQARSTALRAAGEWIRTSFAEHPSRRGRPIIMGYSSAVPYYSGGTLSYLPHTEDQKLAAEYVRWVAPDYVVLRSLDVDRWPYSKAWFSEGVPDPCAQLVTQLEEPGGPMKIWRWRCAAE